MRTILGIGQSTATLAAIGALLVSSSCATDSNRRSSSAEAPTEPRDTVMGAGDPSDVTPIMQAKLGHTHALLDAIAIRDFLQIEVSATALAELSKASDWLAHDTVAYRLFSERFREAAEDVALEAQQGDIDAVSRAYVRLTMSCVDCHSYLRRERLTNDMPGRVSLKVE